MLKKLSIIAAVGALAAMAFAALAPAAAAADPPPDGSYGTLRAGGHGLTAVRGAIKYHATADEGVLLVKDVGGNAEVQVTGFRDRFEWNGWTVYTGFHGTADIKGRDVGVILLGKEIRMGAAGHGFAYLKGRGLYSLNGGDAKPWTEEGTLLRLAAPDA